MKRKKNKINKTVQEDEIYEYFIALYDFQPVENCEIRLTEGMEVLLISKDQPRGWYYGVNENDEYGYFPASYVRKK